MKLLRSTEDADDEFKETWVDYGIIRQTLASRPSQFLWLHSLVRGCRRRAFTSACRAPTGSVEQQVDRPSSSREREVIKALSRAHVVSVEHCPPMDQQLYAKNAAFVPLLSQKVLALANLQPAESVLDFGCGDGVLTKAIQDAQTGRVVGIDNQVDMIEAARKAGIRDARVISAQELSHATDLQERSFDVVLTNAVLHWIPDLGDRENPYILKAIAAAMKPNGRFVGEFGAFCNISEILACVCMSLMHHGVTRKAIEAVMPFYFPTDDDWRETLENAGFQVQHIESEARVTLLPGKVSDWARTFLERYLVLVGDRREDVLDELDTVMELTNKDEKGRYYADYHRLRFIATHP